MSVERTNEGKQIVLFLFFFSGTLSLTGNVQWKRLWGTPFVGSILSCRAVDPIKDIQKEGNRCTSKGLNQILNPEIIPSGFKGKQMGKELRNLEPLLWLASIGKWESRSQRPSVHPLNHYLLTRLTTSLSTSCPPRQAPHLWQHHPVGWYFYWLNFAHAILNT